MNNSRQSYSDLKIENLGPFAILNLQNPTIYG